MLGMAEECTRSNYALNSGNIEDQNNRINSDYLTVTLAKSYYN